MIYKEIMEKNFSKTLNEIPRYLMSPYKFEIEILPDGARGWRDSWASTSRPVDTMENAGADVKFVKEFNKLKDVNYFDKYLSDVEETLRLLGRVVPNIEVSAWRGGAVDLEGNENYHRKVLHETAAMSTAMEWIYEDITKLFKDIN